MTHEPAEGVDTLNEDLRSVKKAFEVLLLAIEAEGIEPATQIAERIVDRIDHIIREMKSGYVQKILDAKFKPFAEDKERFAHFRAEKSRSSDEFIEIVSRLERHIALVDREMRMLMPPPPMAVEWFRRNWRRSLAVAAVALGAFMAWQMGQMYVTRGKGLMGEYYSGTNFNRLVARRRDLSIDFNLRNAAPIRRLNFDNFSVRWTGFIRIPADGSYEFITRSDDGVRLMIDDSLVIDKWTVHRQAVDKVLLQLKAGSHPLKLEWFQRRGPATMQLYWRSGNEAQPRLIEPEFLLPSAS